MSELTTPPPAGEPNEAGGLWHRYRRSPLALQILVPVLVVVVLVLGALWVVGRSDDGGGESTATTVAAATAVDDVMKGIIVVGGLTPPDETVAPSVATTAAPATTPAATTTAAPPSVPATSAAAAITEAPTTTGAPTTAGPTTTAHPTTTAGPTTTVGPTTTHEATTTEVSATTTTTVSGDNPLPTTAAFFGEWNEAAAGSDVPTISAGQAVELTGAYAGHYIITLTPTNGSELPPQVGLLGTLTSPGSGQLATLLLVWIPGPDKASRDFYWQAFGVLTAAVSPGITADETAALERDLGRGPGTPPFADPAEASSQGYDYRALTDSVDGPDGPIDVSAISVA